MGLRRCSEGVIRLIQANPQTKHCSEQRERERERERKRERDADPSLLELKEPGERATLTERGKMLVDVSRRSSSEQVQPAWNDLDYRGLSDVSLNRVSVDSRFLLHLLLEESIKQHAALMSLGKLPSLKALVSNGRRGVQSELSVDMIGPPLGDFRHTMHVGRGGDVFGDTSFLSSYGGSGNSPHPSDSPSRTGFLSRTLQHVRKTQGIRGGSRDLSPPPPPISPIIKNASSLPQLDLDPSGDQKRAMPSSGSAPDYGNTHTSRWSISRKALTRFTFAANHQSLPLFSSPSLPPLVWSSVEDVLPGFHSGFITLPRSSRINQIFPEASESPDHPPETSPSPSELSASRSDSLSSFTLDFGPSLLSDVMQMIDSSRSLSQGLDEVTEHQKRMSITRVDVSMEPERFQEAANVLTRHFGGGRRDEKPLRASSLSHVKTTCSFSETEEEIKV
ncbi:hypothetical protein DNTS_018316 [Danionella cerebrum]|uniref:CRIB domain-containing protein n=1 Tax=Danionella cerebrum TaxID=2873325 RepID=A0A553QES6_9TELE|nr:hypothetical protein DNTS_018316 [Danionella translucida]